MTPAAGRITALVGLDAGAAFTYVITTGALICVPVAAVGSLQFSRLRQTGSPVTCGFVSEQTAHRAIR